ncbi:ribosome assembly RNA-binding protein YhbY [Paratissierella segnis]|uniref:Ribosome assembly RNA-binding protein YhbY n=1 Tax=Paratissierella segnis TaxID=2763679 RepID=A0A926EYP8_9FIRM|nr:ribosome assembly RNA-binding protein YhbY [Paratissierella segnis]MBC8588829.1 ribosome assembly RNA-binding protein YhbY [Paratissierella segnis]
MLTGKQRSYLRGLANNIEPIFQLGKNGLTENFVRQVDEAFEARELVKINVLKNCNLDIMEVVNKLTDELNAEFVQSIGRKFTLYRESIENKKIELPR